MKFRAIWAALALSLGLGSAARAEDIVVTHYASLLYGTPYAIALDKGFFKQAGVDVSSILTSKGGGTSVRNMMAGETLFAEVAFPAALSAAGSATSAYSVSPAIMLRTDVPPPLDVRMPVTSTPASLNQPFWIPTSNAVQPGQSEKPMRSGFAAGAALAVRTARWCALVLKPTVAKTAAIASILFMRAG